MLCELARNSYDKQYEIDSRRLNSDLSRQLVLSVNLSAQFACKSNVADTNRKQKREQSKNVTYFGNNCQLPICKYMLYKRSFLVRCLFNCHQFVSIQCVFVSFSYIRDVSFVCLYVHHMQLSCSIKSILTYLLRQNNEINPLKCGGVRQPLTFESVQCHPGLTYRF